MDSLQLIKLILIGCATFLGITAAFLPFWLQLKVQITWDAGRTHIDKTLDVGIFFMDQGKVPMIDLILVEKSDNVKTLPAMMRVGQIFYGLGISGLFVCTAASILYLLRKYKSNAGNLCLASGIMPSALCLSLGVLLMILVGVLNLNEPWRQLPVPGGYQIIEAYPEISLNFATYIAIVAAILAIAGMIVGWMHALTLCRHVEEVRYQLLTTPLTDDERGLGPGTPGKYNKQPLVSYGGRRGQAYKPQYPGGEVDF